MHTPSWTALFMPAVRLSVHRMIWWCRSDGWVNRSLRCRRWTQPRRSSLMEWSNQPWWPTGWLWLYSKWHYKRGNLLLSQWPLRQHVLHQRWARQHHTVWCLSAVWRTISWWAHYNSNRIIRSGKSSTEKQRYRCKLRDFVSCTTWCWNLMRSWE